jgi:plastocyanin
MTTVVRRAVGGVALAVVVGLVGTLVWWLGSDPRRGEAAVVTNEVVVSDDGFGPPVVEVGVGDTVTWTFVGDEAHDVSGDGFASPIMVDGTHQVAFDRPGTFDYVCTIHPVSMRGRVVVAP